MAGEPAPGASPRPAQASSSALAPVPPTATGFSVEVVKEVPKPEVPKPEPIRYAHRRTTSEVWRCKKGQRTDIKPHEWEKYGYAGSDVCERPIQYDGQTVPIPRVKRSEITPEWFYENFRMNHRPCIVEGVADNWPGAESWSLDALEEQYRHTAFKVGKTDGGKKIRTKFKYFRDYMRHQRDDSPLYLFETQMNDLADYRGLLDDYEVPDIFPDDWFGLINAEARPPYSWWCLGPKRSGTTVHTDPLGTAAWNAVTHGTKHWVIFEPHVPKKVVKGKHLKKEGEDDEAIMYFDFILPRIKKAHPEVRVYEGLQKPGDVIFVPGYWWHGVLNTEDCVAVTQNYCGPDNFDAVWAATRKDREKVANLWLRNMRKYAPDIHARALQLNARDNFKMRHERPDGKPLPDASSSDSESSSDSTSDEPEDLQPFGLRTATPGGLRMGPRAPDRPPRSRKSPPRPGGGEDMGQQKRLRAGSKGGT